MWDQYQIAAWLLRITDRREWIKQLCSSITGGSSFVPHHLISNELFGYQLCEVFFVSLPVSVASL